MGCPHGTQLLLATCFTKSPIGLTHVWSERGPHMGHTWVFPIFKGAFGGPEMGTKLVRCWLLFGSHIGYPHGTQLILATYFTKAPIGLANVWAERVSHMGIMCVSPFFNWAFGGPELGINWVLCGLLCWPHLGCPHGTQFILATCFTKVPIGLAHVCAECGSHVGLMCVF